MKRNRCRKFLKGALEFLIGAAICAAVLIVWLGAVILCTQDLEL